MRIAAITWLPSILLLSACGIDQEAFSPSVSGDRLLASIQLEYNAYNLATASPFNTVQLRTIGISGIGDSVESTVVYSVADSDVLEVSATGVLKALAPAASTVVRASTTRNGLTLVDSAFVSVVSGSPTQKLAQLAIEPNPGDSAKVAAGEFAKILRLIRTDSAGNNMPALLVSVRSSDPSAATITQSSNDINIEPIHPGRVFFYVSSYAYGTAVRDSLSFLIGWPVKGFITAYTRFKTGNSDPLIDFHPRRATIGVGACLVWINSNAIDVDITFDDPSHAGPPSNIGNCAILRMFHLDSGNIAAFRGVSKPTTFEDIFSMMRGRTFSVPGTYTYHSKLYGTTGTIVVCDEVNDKTCFPDNFEWYTVSQ